MTPRPVDPPGLCAVCGRQAAGFGWRNPRRNDRYTAQDPHRRRLCSMCCLDTYARLMKRTEGHPLIRTKQTEREAMAAALTPLGDFVVARGMDRRLAEYSRDEILGLIQTVVTAYHQHLQAAARRAADPMSAPLADFEDQIPF